MNRYCELLAPAGSPEHLCAAIESGADAVYLGGKRFGARANAGNFNDNEIVQAVEYAHLRDAKVYVTMNTLIEQEQLVAAVEYAAFLYERGVDALIVQDLGFARVVRNAMPDFPLHFSTQGSICDKEGVIAAASLGFRRVVLARELTLEEIRECAEASEAEIEVFVHGALCICYSGQCHMSRLRGGRSGNKGMCAQPCRLPYLRESESWGTGAAKRERSHILSPRDLCTIDRIGDFVAAGVSSLKIEGRMKSPEYVAIVTSVYRKYLDEFCRNGTYTVSEEDRYRLNAIFNRGGFTKGYAFGDPGEGLMSTEIAKNKGVLIGTVTSTEKRGIVNVRLQEGATLSRGDGVELRGRNTETGNVVTYLEEKQGDLRIGDFKGNMEVGAQVFKVTDRTLLKEARELFEKPRRVTGVTPEFTAYPGAVPVIEVTSERWPELGQLIVIGDEPAQTALGKPLTEEDVIKQLKKTGNYPFRIERTIINLGDDVHIPVSQINALRRQALDLLVEKKIKAGRRAPVAVMRDAIAEKTGGVDSVGRPSVKIFFRSEADAEGFSLPAGFEDYEVICCVPIASYMKKEFREKLAKHLTTENDTRPIRILPYINTISRGAEDAFIRAHFDEISRECKEKGLYIGNLGWIGPFAETGVPVHGGFGLNVVNVEARAAIAEMGAPRTDTSLEIHPETEFAGAVPVMVTEHRFRAGRPGVKKEDRFKISSVDSIGDSGKRSPKHRYKITNEYDKAIVAVDAAADFESLRTYLAEGKDVIAFI